jgi:hypothetical protein
MTIQFTQDKRHKVVHLDKINRLLNGDEVRADDVLKAGLFLVAEVVRRLETPSFKMELLRENLKKSCGLASKYYALLQCWPGVKEPIPYELRDHEAALGVLKLLIRHSPEREDHEEELIRY